MQQGRNNGIDNVFRHLVKNNIVASKMYSERQTPLLSIQKYSKSKGGLIYLSSFLDVQMNQNCEFVGAKRIFRKHSLAYLEMQAGTLCPEKPFGASLLFVK